MAVAALLLLGACAAFTRPAERPEGEAALTINGSDTMVHLVSTWAEAYMNTHSGGGVSVTGGGSGTGIAALLNRTTDLCMASREIKAEEEALARDLGLELEEIAVGLDAIVPVVHPGNPVSTLTMEQLRLIYNGTYRRWSEVGGPDERILLYSRESSSGTYVFFQEFVLNKEDFSTAARLMPATSTIVRAVTADAWSIGYVGLGYLENAGDRIKALSIARDAESPAVYPTLETVQSGEFPISRALLFYAALPKSSEALSFSTFCLSPQGQQLALESGYVPVN